MESQLFNNTFRCVFSPSITIQKLLLYANFISPGVFPTLGWNSATDSSVLQRLPSVIEPHYTSGAREHIEIICLFENKCALLFPTNGPHKCSFPTMLMFPTHFCRMCRQSQQQTCLQLNL